MCQRLIVNKDTVNPERFFPSSEKGFAITELWYNGEPFWTNAHGMREPLEVDNDNA